MDEARERLKKKAPPRGVTINTVAWGTRPLREGSIHGAAASSEDTMTTSGSGELKRGNSNRTISSNSNNNQSLRSSRHRDKDYQFLAISCSNDHLFLRYSEAGAAPLVRLMSWYNDPSKRIVSMDFSPHATWLMLVSSNGSVFLLPVRNLVCGRASSGWSRDGVINPLIASADTKKRLIPPKDIGAVIPSLATMIKRDKQASKSKYASAPGSTSGAPNTPTTPSSSGAPATPNSNSVTLGLPFGTAPQLPTNHRQSLGAADDITEIKIPKNVVLPATFAASHCLWWRTFTHEDVALV
jgi:hypothetical protein